MNSKFDRAISQLKITRYPEDKKLKAWSSADVYLYDKLCEDHSKNSLKNKSILILGEDLVTVSLLLQEFKPTSISDSIFSQISLKNNAQDNQLPVSNIQIKSIVGFLEKPESLNSFDIVLCKIPKSFEYFKYLTATLAKVIGAESELYFSAMVKYLSPNTKKHLQDEFEQVDIFKTFKKALLFKTQKAKTQKPPKNTLIQGFEIPKLGDFKAYPNTFSIGKLDKGTRLLLDNLKKNSLKGIGADLGCGYGAISKHLIITQTNIKTLKCIDISELAIESTQINTCNAPFGIEYLHQDGLSSTANNSLDFIISNPPFHTQNSLSIQQGLRLFRQAEKSLSQGGQFILVANRALNYKPFLEGLFEFTEVLAESKQYSVFRCVK